ncbi:SDR family NAD(P)-dependent oxidoreductase [Microbulbifer sp. ZKSA006]|uniref:SDR family NAD(P)-dependent oxidoreductase n=1 Tax=Microbulbifer sp. ZKSA006 TaxID=3243390 RepID=UPI004039F65E
MSIASVRLFLQELIASKLSCPCESIDVDSGYYELGLSSVTLMEVVQSIEREFSVALSPILLFEYGNIAVLAEYLYGFFEKEGIEFNRTNPLHPSDTVTDDRVSDDKEKDTHHSFSEGSVETESAVRSIDPDNENDIAVIGMAGRYPEAPNLDVFWDNLKNAKDCIKEVPIDRWNWREFKGFSSPSGKKISKWGGFIDDPYCFDARFFRITPKEARALDPQERLFLEVCWEAMEDAGYTPKNIVASQSTDNIRRVGVFVGVMHKDYSIIGSEALEKNTDDNPLSLSNASIANRVSYFCNFNGPSVAVDTLCSSSLTAVHMAMQSILCGESQVAIAGGVNLSLHANKYLSYGMMDMHSSDGYCHTFGEGGDGYVSSDGVGSIILKPLSDAIRDGDRIYAVLKASAVNHVGKASGITVPEPVMQSNVINDCMKKARVEPQSISYIEAHGTGTSLGDPIEIEGLKRAFNLSDDTTQYCAIGSAKSNIGHAESAAGISGLTKTILQLFHRTLVPSLHAERINPYLDLQSTPFFVQKKTEHWQLLNGEGTVRRAGVSSFGAAGSNAHIILEEYCAEPTVIQKQTYPLLLPVSAKNADRLKQYVERIIAFLQSEPAANINLSSVAFTLQMGREAMEERLIVLAESVDEFLQLLQRVVSENALPKNVWRANVKAHKTDTELFDSNEELNEFVSLWASKGKWDRIARAWVQGYDVNWDLVPVKNTGKRMSLPTYPFERENYRIETKCATGLVKSQPRKTQGFSQQWEGSFEQRHDNEPLLFQPQWREKSVRSDFSYEYKQHYLLLCDTTEAMQHKLADQMSGVKLVNLAPNNECMTEHSAANFEKLALDTFDQIKHIVASKPAGKVAIQILVQNADQAPWFNALSGMLKTTHLENPALVAQLIESDCDDAALLAESLFGDAQHPEDKHIRYRAGQREVSQWIEQVDGKLEHSALDMPWVENGVYLITGGAGGLGLIFAREIAQRTNQSTIIMIGRSVLSQDRLLEIEALKDLGTRVDYHRVDVADRKAVNELIGNIKAVFGKLNGIIHSAGIIQDNFIIKKSKQEVAKVLAPKIRGTVYLDECTQDMRLDFFLLFSSVAGALGNAGQSDYATANAFMDAYAHHRNQLVQHQQRQGRTLSINWPLWEQGGMTVDKAMEESLHNDTGMLALKTDEGVRALYQGLLMSANQVLVMAGDKEMLRNTLVESSVVEGAALPADNSAVDNVMLLKKVRHHCKLLFGKVTHFALEKIDGNETLESYGIDSIMIMRLNSALQEVFGNISKTLFYEYQTLDALAEYFVDEYFNACCQWVGLSSIAVDSTDHDDVAGNIDTAIGTTAGNEYRAESSYGRGQLEPIAIIGISGRYPQANTLEQYWENLEAGKNCITEIPSERWSLDGFYNTDAQEAVKQGKSYSKWGGFVEGFADFDPLFFNISPREAMSMDPQERLFIESCWSVFEGAGYTKEKLAKQHQGRVGIFVGITKTGFSLYGPDLVRRGETMLLPQTSFSSVANRISYMLDLSGPSLSIDTMCSASLTAIHEACEHIHRQECELAVAGGVNLYLHPSNYVALSKQKMLSGDGLCKSFGNGANGFVPGEGVGTLLLKPLSRAEADGDSIYAIIRGSSINHGGKTHGYTIPNPNKQAELVRKAMDKSGVDARTVSYIEAHGTGTELGDPIEVTGLKKAFAQDTGDTGFCAIGSVKSNIGHLEAAAGVAGVTKIVLQMQHKKLVPSLHTKSLNPNIDFCTTPFVVQRGLDDWRQPLVTIDGETKRYPRIAGISSFGAGGSNAHVIIEEYESCCGEDVYADNGVEDELSRQDSVQLIVLSAMNEQRLREVAVNLKEYIVAKGLKNTALPSIAYTLQTGREAMDFRLAMKVHSVPELIEKLNDYLNIGQSAGSVLTGKAEHRGVSDGSVNSPEKRDVATKQWLREKEYTKLLSYWVKGLAIDWTALHKNGHPRTIHLPTYPFAKGRFWFDSGLLDKPGLTNESALLSPPVIEEKGDVVDKSRSVETSYISLRPLEDTVITDMQSAKAHEQSVQLDELPNRKDDCRASTTNYLKETNSSVDIMNMNLTQELISSFAKTLFIEEKDVDIDRQFIDMGLDSVLGVEWIGAINKQYGCSVSATKVYDYPTIREMSDYLQNNVFESWNMAVTPVETSNNDVVKPLKISVASKTVKIEEDFAVSNETDAKVDIQEDALMAELIGSFAEALLMNSADVDIDRQFVDMGLDSIISVEWIGAIKKQYGCAIAATKVYDYTTIREFTRYLVNELRQQTLQKNPLSMEPKETEERFIHEHSQAPFNQDIDTNGGSSYQGKIAIVGMSGKYPGAENLNQYWNNLKKGKNSIREVPASRWDVDRYFDPDPEQVDKTYCKWIGLVDDVEYFDPLFFHISPAEAEMMDPQHRLFLQESYRAFEDAGYSPSSLSKEKCGVYLGVGASEYAAMLNRDKSNKLDTTGHSSAIAAARIAYHLNLKGPALAVDTACSSSLVAAHLACQALKSGEVDMALAGGVSIYLAPESYIAMSAAGMLSPAGQCHPFDDRANGFVPGEGVGTLVLKRLEDAEADGDHIYGVILGSGINQDGRTNGITAPSATSQIELCRDIYDKNNIDPQSISYVEMHGTGTKLGDPIELDALATVFQEKTGQRQYCAVGSVKSNLGHTSWAAGIAGVQKVLMSMQNKTLVPTLNYSNSNEHFDFSDSPFYVNTQTKPWNTKSGPRRAGVSSFGFSGTNAHMVIEEYVQPEQNALPISHDEREAFLVVLSAKNSDRLKDVIRHLIAYLDDSGELSAQQMKDIVYTLQVGRDAMEERLAFIASSKQEFEEKLKAALCDDVHVDLFSAKVHQHKDEISNFKRDLSHQNTIDTWIKEEQFQKILDIWVKGLDIDWRKLYGIKKLQRLSLPTYPFVKKRCWINRSEGNQSPAIENKSTVPSASDEMSKIAVVHDSVWNSDFMQRAQSYRGQEVKLEIIDKQIAIVRMEDRESKNMLSDALQLGLQKAISDVQKNGQIKVMILTGYDNLFCMGGTKDGMMNIANKKYNYTAAPFLYRGLLELDIPVISAMQGHALGGGLIFGLYADICLMAEESIYSANFMQYGFTPGMGATYILGEKLGKNLAMEMMFTAKHFDGKMLKERGATINICRQPSVFNEALRIAKELAKKPRKSLTVLKKEMSGRVLNELLQYIDSEVDMHEKTFTINLVKEAIEDHFSQTENSQKADDRSNVSVGIKLTDIRKSTDKVSLNSDESDRKENISPFPMVELRDVACVAEDKHNIRPGQDKAVTEPAEPILDAAQIVEKTARIIRAALQLDDEDLDSDSTFQELGVDSIASVQIIRKLNREFGLDMESATLYDHFDMSRLSAYISSQVSFSGSDNFQREKSGIVLDMPKNKKKNEEPNESLAVYGSEDDDSQIKESIKRILQNRLMLEEDEITETVTFQEIGVDSIASVEIIRDINRSFSIEVEAVSLYDHCSLNEFTRFVSKMIEPGSVPNGNTVDLKPNGGLASKPENIASEETGRESAIDQSESETEVSLSPSLADGPVTSQSLLGQGTEQDITDIAIIGIAGRFPDADDLDDFWHNIEEMANSITEVPSRKWKQQSGAEKQWIAALKDEDKFDHTFFNVSPREAKLMDPQQRVFLENAWHAFEDAGYSSKSLSGKECGVYVGVGQGDYSRNSGMEIVPQTLIGNAASILASRIAYHMNLTGPCVAVDTACSSSLAAIHLACQSLKQGDCELALAGGVHIVTTSGLMSLTEQMGIISKTGQCRTFDNSADGWVVGEGVGAIVLKPLQKAVADNDTIHGIIKATGINQNGRSNGIASPKPSSQSQLQTSVYQKAHINPETIDYMEVQGTSDKVGDAIEFKGLVESFSSNTAKKQFCALGSLKPNIGHSLAASGIAGVIKVLLALKNKKLPALNTIEKLNENIDLENSPFYINNEPEEWTDPRDGCPRRAGINGFGMSGTNAHIVIEEYLGDENDKQMTRDVKPQLIVLSAKSPEQLRTKVSDLKNYLLSSASLEDKKLSDVAYTLQIGRDVMVYKAAFVATDREQLIDVLEDYLKHGEKQDASQAGSWFSGGGKKNSSEIKTLLKGETGKIILECSIENYDLEKLAFYWINGGDIPWPSLHKGKSPKRVSLPTYPFEKTRHWLRDVADADDTQVPERTRGSISVLDNLDLGQRVVAIFSNIMGVDISDLDLHTSLDQYGYDSILSLQFLQQLQVYINPDIDADQLFSCKSLQEIVDLFPSEYIDGVPLIRDIQKVAYTRSGLLEKFPELIHLNKCTEGRPVFWFHGGLGGVELYAEVAKRCDRPFYGIQAKGWMTDREPLHGIQAMVAYYLHIVQSIQPEGPYDLGGYSLGGMIAYEATRQLQEFGHEVNSIVMLDTMDSTVIKRTSVEVKTAMLQAVNIALEGCVPKGKSSTDILIRGNEVSTTLGDEQFLEKLIKLAKKRGLKKSDSQIRNSIEKSYKVQLAYEANRFTIQPLLDRSTVSCHYFRNKNGVFWGEMEPYFTFEGHGFSIDPEHAWKEWEKECPNFNLIDLDTANHLTLLREPKVARTIADYCHSLYSKEQPQAEEARDKVTLDTI